MKNESKIFIKWTNSLLDLSMDLPHNSAVMRRVRRDAFTRFWEADFISFSGATNTLESRHSETQDGRFITEFTNFIPSVVMHLTVVVALCWWLCFSHTTEKESCSFPHNKDSQLNIHEGGNHERCHSHLPPHLHTRRISSCPAHSFYLITNPCFRVYNFNFKIHKGLHFYGFLKKNKNTLPSHDFNHWALTLGPCPRTPSVCVEAWMFAMSQTQKQQESSVRKNKTGLTQQSKHSCPKKQCTQTQLSTETESRGEVIRVCSVYHPI